ncbi:MAG: flagellar export chaperone FliS, partial [Chloroflexota bacterium]
IDEAHASFVRAQDIVAELINGLDLERGGGLADQLSAIYDYLLRLLVEANTKKSIAPAAEAVKLMTELLGAWQALADGRVDDAIVAMSTNGAAAL